MPNIYATKISQEQWDKTEKEFLAGFYGYFEELNDSIEVLRKNKNNPLIRSQICLAFIAIDTFSRFHRIFQGVRNEEELNKDNEKRFKDWLNEFVFTDKNEYHRKHKDKIKCDAVVVWKLRNSFLHFYSFPNISKKQSSYIGFSFNIPVLETKQMSKSIKKNLGKGIIFVDIYHLIRAIFEGLMTQWKGLAEMIERDPDKYVNSVVFANEIISKTNAKTIRI